jgi:catechol 2,3-dioxygenase-like lactoylglutathione lyase family enzyme
VANLEHLKNQAKLYLRWHRERYHPVAALIRQVLPRYRPLCDRDILDRSFRLSDAQELVARQAGFESWTALRQGFDRMTTTTAPTAGRARMLDAEPQLFVTDMAAALAFYVEKLGFATAFSYGDPPFYAQVARDAARLNLRHTDWPPFDAAFRQNERDPLSATITIDEVKSLFIEYQAGGVTFHQALRTEPWGARTFIVADPAGNLLLFSGPGAPT